MTGTHMKGRRKKKIAAEQTYNRMQERFFLNSSRCSGVPSGSGSAVAGDD